MIVGVPAGLVEGVWPQVSRHLDRALRHNAGELELEDVLAALQRNEMWLLTVVEGGVVIAALVAELVTYPRKRAVRVVLLGGSGLHRWMDEMHDVLVGIARKVGAQLLEIQARPGWERALRKFPIKVKSVGILMEVE